MSEEGRQTGAGTGAAASAGALLRQAREAQGLEVAALASAMKVPPHKIELLESDRFDELHDASFARALALSVCRSLRVDATPVMALLPQVQVQGMGLDHINQGLNTPFRDRPASVLPKDWSLLAKPVVWAPALIGLAALALYFFPADWAGMTGSAASSMPAAAPPVAAVEAASAVPSTVVETVYSAPPQPEAASASAPPVATVSGLLQVRTTAQSWVEVLDARGQMLLSRVIQPGETVGLDGPLPLRVKIGNSAGTQVMFRGEVVELTPFSRENVARLELK
jgi:cytoskeleton protein RodZ